MYMQWRYILASRAYFTDVKAMVGAFMLGAEGDLFWEAWGLRKPVWESFPPIRNAPGESPRDPARIRTRHLRFDICMPTLVRDGIVVRGKPTTGNSTMPARRLHNNQYIFYLLRLTRQAIFQPAPLPTADLLFRCLLCASTVNATKWSQELWNRARGDGTWQGEPWVWLS